MADDKLLPRTRAFALSIVRFVQTLPRRPVPDVLARQLVRCGTSVGANYRAACRARSTAEFVAKLGIVEEEADEAAYWLELLIDAEVVQRETAQPLIREAGEIVAMTVASIRTARNRSK